MQNDGFNYMYQLESEPTRLNDFNDYFLKAKAENNDQYFLHFLHHYEKTLNRRIRSFIFRYSISVDRLPDLKQIFIDTLWERLQNYSAKETIPLLQIAKFTVQNRWHDYVRLNCSTVIVPEAQVYKNIRAVARLYFEKEYSMPNEELLKYLSEQMKLTEKKIQKYIEIALYFRYVSSISLDDDEFKPNTVSEETLADSVPSVLDTVMYIDRRDKYVEAARSLSPKDLKLLELSTGVCLNCIGNIKAETYELIAMKLGMADASGVAKKRKRVIKKFLNKLEELGYVR